MLFCAGFNTSSEGGLQSSKSESPAPSMEDKTKSINQKLSLAEEQKNVLLEELELVKMEKRQITKDYETLKSEYSKFKASVSDEQADLKTQAQVPEYETESLQREVVRLQQALLGMKQLGIEGYAV